MVFLLLPYDAAGAIGDPNRVVGRPVLPEEGAAVADVNSIRGGSRRSDSPRPDPWTPTSPTG